MKTEVGQFTPPASTGSTSVFLNDSTLVPKGVFFEVSKTGSNVNNSSGFSDGSANRARWSLHDSTTLDSGRSANRCILHKKLSGGASVTALDAQVTSFATGQINMTFNTTDVNYTVNYMVVGD